MNRTAIRLFFVIISFISTIQVFGLPVYAMGPITTETKDGITYSIFEGPTVNSYSSGHYDDSSFSWEGSIHGRLKDARLVWVEEVAAEVSLKQGRFGDLSRTYSRLYDNSEGCSAGMRIDMELNVSKLPWKDFKAEKKGTAASYFGCPAVVVTDEAETITPYTAYTKNDGTEVVSHSGKKVHKRDIFICVDDIDLPDCTLYLEVSIYTGAEFKVSKVVSHGEAADKLKDFYSIAYKDFEDSFKLIQLDSERKVTRNKISQAAKAKSAVKQTEESDASKLPGIVTVAVLSTVVAGAAASSAGPAAGEKGSDKADSEKSDDERKNYRMVIYKEFGDSIRYNGDTVYVYAKIIEVGSDGTEHDRPDLTGRIEIFSEDEVFEFGTAAISGEYLGVSVSAVGQVTGKMPEEGIISFRFNGEGGVFQNNVRFKIIGKCYIELTGENLYALAGSGESFRLIYKLKDFLNEAVVNVKAMKAELPFSLETGEDEKGNKFIAALDSGRKEDFSEFFGTYSCEIIAENDKEFARTVFYVVMCHEGLLPVFAGKKKEIIACKNKDNKMEETIVSFKAGIWNKTENTLDIVRPEGLNVECNDIEGIFEAVGLEYGAVDEEVRKDAVIYKFKAEKPLPATEPVKGRLKASCTAGERSFENEMEIELLPDRLQYEADLKKEFENCIRIIDTYLPESFRQKKIDELNRSREKMGIDDLKLFRKNCWEIAQRSIMQDKESYLIDSYWYDEAIATAELLVYIGDAAFDVALAPFGGPIAGFLAAQVKGAFIDLVSMYVEKPGIGFTEIMEFLDKRFVQMVGQADGAFEMPKPDEPKKLAAWLACYTIYRIAYHWWYDRDDSNNPVGLSESIKRGLMDFAGKGASGILAGFAGDIAKKKGWDKYSIAEADQKLTNDTVEKGAKAVLELGDKAAARADAAVGDAVNTLLKFIDKIKSGAVSF